jgi:hypothetical protein
MSSSDRVNLYMRRYIKDSMEKEYKAPWIDILAAVLATFRRLLIPFVVLVAALFLAIVIFRVLFL